MPRLSSDDRKVLSVVLTAEARKALEAIAQKRVEERGETFYASDIAREAIQEYLERHGYKLEVKVNRGGYRERSNDED